MANEVLIEHSDPQEITTRHYTVKSVFTYKDSTYEVGNAIALDDAEAQDLIAQGLLVNPDGDQPPEDQVAPASEPFDSAQESPVTEEPPPKEAKKGSRSTDKG